MKKQLLNLFLLAVLVGSCGKTTKGKIVNDWKMTLYEEIYTTTDPDGDHSVGTLKLDGATYSHTEDDEGTSFDYSATGSVAYNNYEIKKDGTWSSESEVNYIPNANTTSTKVVRKKSGTWSFVGKSKNEDFKKNERILFNTLLHSEVRTDEDDPDDPETFSATYLTGENTAIYTVTGSKAKKLELELNEDNTWVDNGDTYLGNRTIKIVLED